MDARSSVRVVLGIHSMVGCDGDGEASLQIVAEQLVEPLEETVRQRLAGSVGVLYEVGQRHIQQVEPTATVDGEANFQRITAQVPVIDTWRWPADELRQAVDPELGYSELCCSLGAHRRHAAGAQETAQLVLR